MYNSIYIPVDNSDLSNRSIEIAVQMANKFGSKCIGSHVYAAVLHDLRFKQMESGLPPKYLEEEVLEEQRDIHDNLITKGLNVISESYLDVFRNMCKEGGVDFQCVSLEGRNFEELAKDIKSNPYDFVIMGATGQGNVKLAQIGSVCERVVRRISTDTLVVKNNANFNNNKIMVAIDGSSHSYGGLLTAIDLAKEFNMEIEIVGVFDPYFHYTVFNSIATVLSEEDTNTFNFQEQEQLHEEIINSGLAKIYQQFLNIGEAIVKENDFTCTVKLIAGKGYEKIVKRVNTEKPALLVLGKIGIHSQEDADDIGNTTENLLRLVDCNMLISSKTYQPPMEKKVKEIIEWTNEATQRLEKIPPFVRGMAKKTIEEHAVSNGHSVVTTSIIDAVLSTVLPESMRDGMGLN